MPKLIEVPGMGVVEFPDGMTDQQISAAIQANMPKPKPASAADDVGALQAALIAAGRTTDKVVQGVRQVYNKATGDDATLAKMAKDEADKDSLYAPLRAARPMATGIGEALPMMAVPVGGAANTAAFLGRSAIAGALPGALSYGTAGERLKGAAVGAAGGAVGGGIGLGAAKLLKPAGAGAAGLSDDALAAADRLGMKLSAGQRTQNQGMLGFENYLAKSPGSAGAMQSRATGNQVALNRAAAKAMGQGGDSLDEGAFAAAKTAIGDEFGRLQGITAPKLDQDFMAALVKVDSDNAAKGAFRLKSVDSVVDKALDLAAQNNLSGKAYKEIRTQLSNDATAAYKAGDATLGGALKTIRKALDDAAKKSLSPDDQKAWDVAREQWQAYKILTKSNVAEAGDVSAARVAAQMRRGGDQFRTGASKGELADIGRVGEAVKSVQNPNSGQLAMQMLYGNPITGLPMMAGNKAMSMAYNNPLMQRYLSQGLLDVGPAGATLLGRAGGPTGQPLLQNWLGAQ